MRVEVVGDATLYCADWKETCQAIGDHSIDAIITDLPYQTTACKWDVMIPFAPMWAEVKRILKPRGAFVTTASQPFTSALVMSNVRWFKYEDIWQKTQATGHLNCKIMPMREHENILVFGDGHIVYNPQIMAKSKANIRPRSHRGRSDCYGVFDGDTVPTIPKDQSYPRSVIRLPNANNGERGLHPTQKPVALYEYLIRTYTNEGDTVLDFCFGSGTTAVACARTGRHFVGGDNSPEYFGIAVRRVREAQMQLRMPLEI